MDPIRHPDDHKHHEALYVHEIKHESEEFDHPVELTEIKESRVSSEPNASVPHKDTKHEGFASRNDSSAWKDSAQDIGVHSYGTSVEAVAGTEHVNSSVLPPHEEDDMVLVHKHADTVVIDKDTGTVMVHEDTGEVFLHENADAVFVHEDVGAVLVHKDTDALLMHEEDNVIFVEEENGESNVQVEPQPSDDEEDEPDALEERLQLYSEVLSLQKELAVVKEDEQQLRQKLQDTQMLINEYDPQIEKIVSVLEDEAEQSPLRNVWEEQCQKSNPDTIDWSEINLTNLKHRVQEARRMFMMTTERVDMLYSDRDARINEDTDEREQKKAQLKEQFDAEMEKLQELRSQLKQIKEEQDFHRRRGTARVGNRNVVPNDVKRHYQHQRIGEDEIRTSSKVEGLRATLTELMEECKVLKKQLDESQRLAEQRKNTLEEALNKTQEEGTDARNMRKILEEEKDELSALKVDLQGVLHYVRAAKREDEIF